MDEMQKAKIKLSQTMAAADNEARRYEELVNKNQEFAKVVADKEKQVASLYQEIETKRGDSVILAEDLIDIQDKIEVAKKSLSGTEDALEEKQKEVEEVSKSITAAKEDQAIDADKFQKEMDKSTAKLQAEITELESERQGLLDGNKTIADGNAKLEVKKLELDGEIKSKNDELSGVQKQIDLANNSVASLNNKAQVSEADYNRLELDKKNIEEEIESLKKDKKSAEDNLKAVNSKLDEMTRYRINLIQKGKDVNKALAKIQELYKSAGINSTIDVNPIVVPSEDN